MPLQNTQPCFYNIRSLSIPKFPDTRNEDAYAVGPDCVVVADGVTTKTAFAPYGESLTGADVARLVADCAASSENDGVALVAELNAAVAARLQSHGVGVDAEARPGCVLSCLRIRNDRLIVTRVGDIGVRVNGGEIFVNHALVDDLTSAARAHYIRVTGDVAGGRDFILPLLQAQIAYRNHAAHPLGYGVIDGGVTPDKFVSTEVLPLMDIHQIEVFTDGYPAAPISGGEIEAWERRYREVMEEDPDRCGTYPSTKANDDRTLVIAGVR